MSGWDEGAVFYSDQAQFPRGAPGGDPSSDITRHSALRNESLVHNRDHVTVAIEDLDAFDAELSDKIRKSPADYLPLFETAASEVLASLRSKVAGETGEMEEPVTGDVQIFLSSKENCLSMRSIGADYMSKLVKIAGITIAASRVKAKATHVMLLCKNCRSVKTVPCRPGLGGAIVPRSCDHVPQPGEEPCPLDPWIAVPDKSKYVDLQTLKLQENPEDVPTGELPRNMLLSVDRHLVQTIVPGTRLTVVGIYSVYQASANQKGAVGVKQPYIRVVGLEQSRDANSNGPSNFTLDEEMEFKEFAQRPDAYAKICLMIGPSIYGHSDVKKAIACLLFGGSKKFLKFVEKTAPIAVYTSGKGSSAAGLTASVIRDGSSCEFYLEGGAMVLADGGVVCIDEFDKMRPEDRVAIHEAMEQQTISIAKAGITTVLNSRTSVLAAANPITGRYDDLKTAQDNIDLQTTILSRFDLIFIVKDVRMYDQDKQIASHIIKVHASGAAASSKNTDASDGENWLKRYIEYCRVSCKPRLSEKAAEMLQNKYVEIRQKMRQQAHELGRAAAIPITVRQLEAIIRLSESLAKMRLTNVATPEHVEEAFRLFNVSTVDAARSGINEHLNLSPDIANEIKQAEAQIKRRVGIGSHISERRLIDELNRMGMNESIVRRALLIMHQRDEVEYKRERHVIVRKA
ncbi:hypothetical protein E2562_038651 [Oryza meyeriana var. granulata]|uniref:DNA replication licensing factor MCM5 n=1 Tax=Oryza meyeriana var. granulata TaxID=110450 RepID=A0A6G1E8K3_9ORYZ|nr:hypothetical protein E2562_038651 [Oryza meyeriana var. granulata]